MQSLINILAGYGTTDALLYKKKTSSNMEVVSWSCSELSREMASFTFSDMKNCSSAM